MVLDDQRRAPGNYETTRDSLTNKNDDPCDDCSHWAGNMNKNDKSKPPRYR